MLKRFAKILLVAGAAMLSFSAHAAPKEGVVRGSYINLRQDAKFNSPIIGKKMRGDSYKIIFEEKNWLKVSFSDGLEGWLYRTLVEKSTEAPAKADSVKAVASGTPTVEKKATEKKSEKTEKPAKKEIKIESSRAGLEKPPVVKVKPAEIVEISGTAEELYNEAIRLYEKKKYSQALEKNQLAIQKAPQNAEILNNIGNCQFKLGRIEEALESWKNALKIAPRSGKICNNLGIAYYQLDKNKDAIEYYKKAILFEPEFADPYYNLASVFGFTGNFADAIVNYRKFLEFSPDATMKKLAEERIAYCERHVEKPDKTN